MRRTKGHVIMRRTKGSQEFFDTFEELNDARSEYAEALELLSNDIEIEKISDDVKEMLMRHTNWSTDQEDDWVSAGINCDILMDTLGNCAQHHNTELIPDDMFDQSYVEEMLRDQVAHVLPSWVVVDWEQTVDNVRQDYTSVTLDDVTYWTIGC